MQKSNSELIDSPP